MINDREKRIAEIEARTYLSASYSDFPSSWVPDVRYLLSLVRQQQAEYEASVEAFALGADRLHLEARKLREALSDIERFQLAMQERTDAALEMKRIARQALEGK